ncbi:hypothetical protein [uncultured Winogradskyella sp.]|uniref:hypothetical protein n=1 Tax=uncultured Winogradskyella sp. TaxID=395353 RepID=UPI00263810CE|nr:hypothetical protein [uncultured Winogradskyella sp.]
MDIERIKEASALLKELEDLKKYESLFNDREYSNSAHFEVVQHYGSLRDSERVDIPKRFTDRFKKLLNTVIVEIEEEISNI